MAVPKRKQSNSRTGMRRSHHAIKPKQLTSCPKCGTPTPTHVVCSNCGHYAGRTVVESDE
ncbi:MAG TPA: 50S ribosomal protein L32 [Lacipirellulaceae bacterium]|nr:50S ribosomal protein L32 [Lacipirellulaceae bacterium]